MAATPSPGPKVERGLTSALQVLTAAADPTPEEACFRDHLRG